MWQQEIVKKLNRLSLPTVIVGIKTGEEKIRTEKGKRLADELQSGYYETSLKDTKHISSILKEMAQKVLKNAESSQSDT